MKSDSGCDGGARECAAPDPPLTASDVRALRAADQRNGAPLPLSRAAKLMVHGLLRPTTYWLYARSYQRQDSGVETYVLTPAGRELLAARGQLRRPTR